MRVALCFIVVLAVSACAREPDATSVQSEVQRRLDEDFQPDLFTIRSFRRAGSAPFRDVDRGLSGRLVYFNAVLEFQEAFNLASWSGLNVGTLLHLLGATHDGVDGFSGEGNAAGDELLVHGRVLYTEGPDGWEAVDLALPQPDGDEVQTLEGVGVNAVLEQMRTLLEQPAPEAQSEDDRIIRAELRRANWSIESRIARARGLLQLLTGKPPQRFYTVGSVFAEWATEHGFGIHATPTAGSLENALLVASGDAEFAFCQNDVAQVIYKGWFEEGEGPREGLRSVLSLWPVALQLVALESSDLKGIRDLAGRRLAIGAVGSGARFTARRVAIAAELTEEQFPELEELSVARGLERLEAGAVDAVLLTEPVPMPLAQDLATRLPLRWVSIEADVVASLVRDHESYFDLTIPARSYPGQRQPVRTLGLTATIITNAAIPEATVEAFLEQVFASLPDIETEALRAAFIGRNTARTGLSIPLHPAAERWLDAQLGSVARR